MSKDNENPDMQADAQTASSDQPQLPDDWQDVPTDPHPEQNLGYAPAQWERIPVADDPDQVIFLPSEEEDIAEDAFIVTDDSDLSDLIERR